MTSPGKIFGMLSLLFVFCLMTEASPGSLAGKGVQAAPQKQTLVDFVPMNQVDGGSDDEMDSVSSESSESSETDDDNDMDTNANNAAATTGNNAAPAPAAAPVPVGSGNGNQVGGNMLPNTRARDQNQMLGRESGSSGQSVGIAFAVVGLVAVVVVGAIFAIRRQRRSNFA